MHTVTGGGVKKAAAYLLRWQQLWARYEREAQSSDWHGFIEWLLARRSGLRPATWRQYRAAVVYVLNLHAVADAEYFHARLMERPINPVSQRDLPARTSSSKAKTLPNADMGALVDHLSKHEGRWDQLTGLWLIWGSITGLRPVEWRDVEPQRHEGEVILSVHNAKHDAQRANGPIRTVHVRHSEEALASLLDFIKELQAEQFEEVYEGCRLALRRATKTLWPRRKKQITLYSARHQFAADAKSAGLAPEVIAALMGHAVVETHEAHYGKRRSGRGHVAVEAEAADIARVIKRRAQKSLAMQDTKASFNPNRPEGVGF